MNTRTSTPVRTSKIQVRSSVRAGAAAVACSRTCVSCCSSH